MKLEYRLDDVLSDFPALWRYDDISLSELVCRMTCEYFYKDGKNYIVSATSKEPNNENVIYIKEEGFNSLDERKYKHIGLEFKEVISKDIYNFIESKDLDSHDEALHYLHCDYVYLQRGNFLSEFKLDSRELDEDRKCYIFYGNFTGRTI
jgi:hypothetical protein